MTEHTALVAPCIYYAGCDEPRNACGYCDTHCLCGAPPHPAPLADAGLPDCEGWTCQSCGADNYIPDGFARVTREQP